MAETEVRIPAPPSKPLGNNGEKERTMRQTDTTYRNSEMAWGSGSTRSWKRLAARLAAIVILATALSALVQAQYLPDASIKALVLLNAKQAWVLTDQVPDGFRFCAGTDPDGALRGCVTAKELRAQALKERGRQP